MTEQLELRRAQIAPALDDSFQPAALANRAFRKAVQADGTELTTIEGLAGPPLGLAPFGSAGTGLHPVQEGFWEKHGLQCGFCTPGMILTAVQLLNDRPRPSEAEIRRAIAGNLCRCTGYQHIVDAIQYAAKKMPGLRPPKSAALRQAQGRLADGPQAGKKRQGMSR